MIADRNVENCLIPLAVALLAFAVGCNTIAVMPRKQIDVPTGLTQQEVESVILRSALGLRPATADEQRAAEEAGFENPEFIQIQYSDWTLETRHPGVITASTAPRTHYLRVAIEYDARSVQVKIDDARNMNYSGEFIHHKAFQWIRGLEQKIKAGFSSTSSI